MSYIIKYSKEADEDLLDMVEYLSDYSIQIAEKFTDSIIDKINSQLSFMPYMYREYFDGIRFIPYKGYIVFYRILEEEKIVEILSVVHGSRDLNNIGIKK